MSLEIGGVRSSYAMFHEIISHSSGKAEHVSDKRGHLAEEISKAWYDRVTYYLYQNVARERQIEGVFDKKIGLDDLGKFPF